MGEKVAKGYVRRIADSNTLFTEDDKSFLKSGRFK
jgi:hypothetical protein